MRLLITCCLLWLPMIIVTKAAEINVMSFNIRVPVDAAPKDWSSRRSAAFHVIESEAPDVIGFQELVHSQKVDLEKHFPRYTFIGIGRERDGSGESVRLFVNTDRFTIDVSEQGTFWFSNTPDIAGSSHWGNQYLRICSWVRLIEKQTGKGLYIFNNHWGFSPEFQSKATRLLLKRIAGRTQTNEQVVIIGDLNATPEAVAIEKILLNQFNDVWQESEQQHQQVSAGATFHAFSGDAKDRIDYIFYSAESLKLRSFKIHDQKINGVWPSDHFPISAVFSY